MVYDAKSDRELFDFYVTPPKAVRLLLQVENFDGICYEPCCGNGMISKTLEDNGFDVISSDIQSGEHVYGEKNVDFLKLEYLDGIDNIITNPPYGKEAELFIKKSKEIANKKIAMLLRLQYLESKGRNDLLNDKTFPLSKIIVFSDRIDTFKYSKIKGLTFEEIDKLPTNKGMIAYCWFIWDKNYSKKNA